MKKLHQLSMAVVLSLILATGAGASAGIIHTGASSPATNPPPATESDTTQKGIIHTPNDQQNSPTPSDVFYEIRLNLLQSVLLLF